MNRAEEQINVLDGFLLNLFKVETPVLDESQFDNPEHWVCNFLDQSVDMCNKYIRHKLAKCEKRIDRLQFLYTCRSCMSGVLDDLKLSKPTPRIPCCDISPPSEIKNAANYDPLKKEKEDELHYQQELVVYKEKVHLYQKALQRIEKAICFYEDCKNIDCLEEKKPFSGLSNNQKVLLTYYGLKSIDYEIRGVTDIAPIAKIMHLIFDVKFTVTKNSDLYNRLRKAPNFNKDRQLIEDLKLILPYFERVELKPIIKQIKNDIETARKELKASRKQK